MVTLVRAIQTSIACPSQWDAWDADGNYYYLRYRSGFGSIQRFDGPIDDYPPGEWGQHSGEVIATFEHGHPLDGWMTLDEFAVHAGINLELAENTPFWRNIKDKLDIEFAGDEEKLGRVENLLLGIDLDQE